MLSASDALLMKADLNALVDKYTIPVVPGPGPGRTLYHTYFGYAAGNAKPQSDHVNMVFIPEWGEEASNYQVVMERNIGFMKEAQAAGIQNVVYDVSYQLWSGTRVSPTAAADLMKVFGDLKNADVLHMVRAVYAIDEPDLRDFSDSTLITGVGTLRAAMHQFVDMADTKVWCIYAQNGTPGMSAFDAVGSDHYGNISSALNWYGRVPSGTGKLLVPGGASPWKDDPTPFVNFALADPSVVAMISFLFVDYGGGQGIASNGMLPAYRGAGQRLINQK